MVGVPIDSFGKPGGTVLAPAALRDQGIVEILGARDGGDLDVRIVGTERDPESGIVGYPTVVSTCKGVRDGVAPLIRGGAFPVLGCCCTLVPGVAAALRASDPGPAGLAYIDGHLDLYGGRRAARGRRRPWRPLAPHPACAGLNLMCYDVDMDDAERSSARALVELAGASLLPARDPVGGPDARAGVAEEAAASPGDADRPVLG